MNDDKKKLVTFLDNVSRTIIGRKIKEDDNFLYIESPVVVNVVPQQDPNSSQVRMSLQLFPLFFREFLADKDTPITWKYDKKTIALPDSEVVFDWRLQVQYDQLFASVPNQPGAAAPQNKPASPEVIKLFED